MPDGAPSSTSVLQRGTEVVVVRDGRRLSWEGFHTGPMVLEPKELDEICRRLLGLDLADIGPAVRAELEPHAVTSDTASSILLNGASTMKGCFEADLAALAEGRPGDDFATYNEARAVYLAGPDDLVVGRTGPWRDAAEVAGVEAVALPDSDHYYLSHALLKLAIGHGDRPAPQLERILDRLRRSPLAVVRVFALDVESRVLLLWLKRTAGLARLRVDANGPEVADRWNHKSSLHPTAVSASELPWDAGRDPFAILAAESALTPLGAELGLLAPRLPGYTVVREGGGRDELLEQMRCAAELLRERYGLRLGCLKPSTALTGSRIRTAVALDTPEVVDALVDQMLETDEDYILEAHADYLRHAVEGHEFILAPSAHIRAGRLGEGATMQITRGSVWQGNVYVDEHACARLGLSVERYDFIRASTAELLHAFRADGRDRGLVKGGIDYAVARVGGRFGDAVLVAMQDLNLSSNGAEYVRAFLDEARQALPCLTRVYAATKTIRPAAGAGLRRLKEIVDGHAEGWHARALVSCPGRWGLVAVGSADPVNAAESVLRLERDLSDAGMIDAVALTPASKEAHTNDRSG
jgi:hypothetical protein